MARVVCVQLAPEIGDLEHNRQMSVAAVEAAAGAGADVIVLPELVTSGYCFDTADEAARVAIDPGHPVFTDWARAGRGAMVFGGFAEQAPDGTVYNSAAAVDGDGVRAVYRKTHLWDREKLLFTPGVQLPPVLDTAVGRLGFLICYDLEFPEMTRSLGLRGADLIAVPTNWPLVERPAGEHAPEVGIAMAAARVNRVYIACCDRSGTERGQEWTQGTAIIDAAGWLLTDAVEGTGSVSADVDLSLARDKRISPHNDLFDDRRPSLYG